MPESLIVIPKDLSIYLGVKPVDMRKSFDGLSAWIHDQLQLNPMHHALFIFRNKRNDRVKCLYWDRNGFALWYKRLEKGTFKWPKSDTKSQVSITSQELHLLLDGVDIDKLKRLPSLSFEADF